VTEPIVVLLHAFPLDPRMWEGVAAVLDGPVVTPALPGPGREPSMAVWAERILEETEGPVVPVGVSMGGYTAFELVRQAPERIAALALVDTRPGADSPEGRAARDDTIAILRGEGPSALWARVGPKLLAAGAPDTVVAEARAIALDQDPETPAAAGAAMRDRPDSTPLLSEIRVPVLVVHGEEDATIPIAEAEAMAAVLPRARLVRMPGTGHLPPLERPAELAAEIGALLGEAG
jgi:pimeloyl-ACP methyl ester carboxylesterase